MLWRSSCRRSFSISRLVIPLPARRKFFSGSRSSISFALLLSFSVSASLPSWRLTRVSHCDGIFVAQHLHCWGLRTLYCL